MRTGPGDLEGVAVPVGHLYVEKLAGLAGSPLVR
jgi:hypothetical protein